MGRHTLTGILTTIGKINEDWTADYRLFSRERFNSEKLFSVIRQTLGKTLSPDQPLIVAMDDTLLRKSGKKISGASWRKDPLGPPFQVNLIWAQRFLQVSAALPTEGGKSWARMIPISFEHCPTPKKPRKFDDEEKKKNYAKIKREMLLTNKAAQRLNTLRSEMDKEKMHQERRLICVVDGGYTNRNVFRNIPRNTTIIGRIRKDSKIYEVPKLSERKVGRRRMYGDLLPTPEQIRQDDNVTWQKEQVWAAGKTHDFRIKVVKTLMWRTAGADKILRLVIIAPLAYRLTKKSKLLYRKPSYLISTDPTLPIQKILQYYIWRWDIEVNFKDQKTTLGIGNAQVRHSKSVEQLPQFMTATYAMLQLAAWKKFMSGNKHEDVIKKPKWQKTNKVVRHSTQSFISRLRAELWGNAIGVDNFSHFRVQKTYKQTNKKRIPNMKTAVIYAYN